MVDPKLQRMFDRCQAHKHEIDKKRRLIRAAMFFPPALLAVLCFIHMVLSVVSGILIAMGGGMMGGFSAAPFFILSVAIAVFVSGETLLENKALIDASDKFYPIAAVVCAFAFVLAAYMGAGDLLGVVIIFGQLGMVFSCVLSMILNIFYKRLYAENEMLRTLKGYPHFNILLLTEADLREKDVPDHKPLEEMTPDERLMHERDFNL